MPVSKAAYRKKRTAIDSEETRQKKAAAGRSSKGESGYEVKRNETREEKLAKRIDEVVAKAKAEELASASMEEIDINGENVFRNRFVLSRRTRVRAEKLG